MLLHKLLTMSLFLCVSVIIFNLMFEHRELQWHRANSGSMYYCVSWVPQCSLYWTFLLRVKCHSPLTMLYVDNLVEIPLCSFFLPSRRMPPRISVAFLSFVYFRVRYLKIYSSFSGFGVDTWPLQIQHARKYSHWKRLVLHVMWDRQLKFQ